MGAREHHSEIMEARIMRDDEDACGLGRHVSQLIENLAWARQVEVACSQDTRRARQWLKQLQRLPCAARRGDKHELWFQAQPFNGPANGRGGRLAFRVKRPVMVGELGVLPTRFGVA